MRIAARATMLACVLGVAEPGVAATLQGLAVHARLSKPAYVQGEPILLAVCVRDLSGRNLAIRPAVLGRTVAIEGRRGGESLPFRPGLGPCVYRGVLPLPAHHEPRLDVPFGGSVATVVPLANVVGALQRGTHTVRVAYTLPSPSDQEIRWAEDERGQVATTYLWSGECRSDELTLEVIAGDACEQRLFDELWRSEGRAGHAEACAAGLPSTQVRCEEAALMDYLNAYRAANTFSPLRNVRELRRARRRLISGEYRDFVALRLAGESSRLERWSESLQLLDTLIESDSFLRCVAETRRSEAGSSAPGEDASVSIDR